MSRHALQRRLGLCLALLAVGVPVAGLLSAGEARADSVTVSATLHTVRYGTSAVWDGTNAYIFGGYGSTSTRSDEIVRYNPGTNTVTTMTATLPTGRAFTSAVWDGTNAYIFAGTDGSLLNQIVRYNPDTTPPVITPTITGTLGTNGWYRSAVTVTWSVTDAESPISSSSGCAASTVSSDTAGTTFTCTATSAGGTASQSVSVKRDATAPSVTGARSPVANAEGWNNADVVASWTCTDTLSNVSSVTGNQVVSSEGSAQSRTGTCTDNAGNSASNTVDGINIDLTAPSVSVALSGTAGRNGWWVSAVTATLSCTDALSGVPAGALTYALNGVAGNDSGPVDISGDGVHSLVPTCVDHADNTGHEVASVRIDTTAPDGAVESPLLAVGAYDANWTAFDATSGVARVVVQERPLLGLLGDAWIDVCDVAIAGVAGENVTGSCSRDPGSGQYCYREVVEDVAGNAFTSLGTDLADLLAPGSDALSRCTVQALPSGLPAAATPPRPEVGDIGAPASVPARVGLGRR